LNFGPFDLEDSQLKLFLNDVIEFKTNYTFKSYIPLYYNDYFACNLWNVNQLYNFAQRGHMNVKLKIIRSGCDDINKNHSRFDLFINKLIWVHLMIIVLAFYSLIKTWIVVNRMFERIIKYKTKNDKVI
jgi:hypothetical protein